MARISDAPPRAVAEHFVDLYGYRAERYARDRAKLARTAKTARFYRAVEKQIAKVRREHAQRARLAEIAQMGEPDAAALARWEPFARREA